MKNDSEKCRQILTSVICCRVSIFACSCLSTYVEKLHWTVNLIISQFHIFLQAFTTAVSALRFLFFDSFTEWPMQNDTCDKVVGLSCHLISTASYKWHLQMNSKVSTWPFRLSLKTYLTKMMRFLLRCLKEILIPNDLTRKTIAKGWKKMKKKHFDIFFFLISVPARAESLSMYHFWVTCYLLVDWMHALPSRSPCFSGVFVPQNSLYYSQ